MIESTTVYGTDRSDPADSPGVSWRAIIAGAVAAAALSLILILLGAGFGFSAVSPWASEGISAKALGFSAILWLALTQIIASGLGGYIAGRLRVRWSNVHDDEVYFRDTAHGFLAWSVATLITAALVLSSVGSLVGGGVQAGTAVASSAATGAAANAGVDGAQDYYIDSLFRADQAIPGNEADLHQQTMRIFAASYEAGRLSDEDRQYLGRLVTQRTGLTQPEAEARVEALYNRASQAVTQAETKVKEAADAAKKVAAWTSLWMFVALLCGAFVASLAATFGGKQRDRVVYTRTLV